MSAAALIPTDLAWVRLLTDTDDRNWDAGPTSEDGPTVGLTQQRVADAARFTVEQPGVRRRLGELIIDIDECDCTWMRTASLAPAVIASALRRRSEEWSAVIPVGGVHPLADDVPQHSSLARRFSRNRRSTTDAQTKEHSVAVLTLPDAAVRLFLDALDRYGVSVQRISTLYHALARLDTEHNQAGNDDAPLRATVLVEPDRRLVWTWSRNGALLAAGRVALHSTSTAQPAAPAARGPVEAAQRLALDWSAWSAYLAAAPASLKLTVPRDAAGSPPVAATVERLEAITGLDATTRTPDDTIAHIVRSQPASSPTTPRHNLTRLTARPTRATRARYLVTAASLLIAAVAIAGFGWRINAAADRRAQAADTERQQRIAWVEQNVENIDLTGPRPATTVLRQAIRELEQREPFVEPPQPLPLTSVFDDFLTVLTKDDYPDIQLASIDIGEASGDNRATVAEVDRAFATEFIFDLESIEGPVRWEFINARGDQREFRGEWRR